MFILDRLISRSSRSLGAMLGTARRGAGHAQGSREGESDDAVRFLPPALRFSPVSSSSHLPAPRSAHRRYGSLFP
jgi:hypothetical protein